MSETSFHQSQLVSCEKPHSEFRVLNYPTPRQMDSNGELDHDSQIKERLAYLAEMPCSSENSRSAGGTIYSGQNCILSSSRSHRAKQSLGGNENFIPASIHYEHRRQQSSRNPVMAEPINYTSDFPANHRRGNEIQYQELDCQPSSSQSSMPQNYEFLEKINEEPTDRNSGYTSSEFQDPRSTYRHRELDAEFMKRQHFTQNSNSNSDDAVDEQSELLTSSKSGSIEQPIETSEFGNLNRRNHHRRHSKHLGNIQESQGKFSNEPSLVSFQSRGRMVAENLLASSSVSSQANRDCVTQHFSNFQSLFRNNNSSQNQCGEPLPQITSPEFTNVFSGSSSTRNNGYRKISRETNRQSSRDFLNCESSQNEQSKFMQIINEDSLEDTSQSMNQLNDHFRESSRRRIIEKESDTTSGRDDSSNKRMLGAAPLLFASHDDRIKSGRPQLLQTTNSQNNLHHHNSSQEDEDFQITLRPGQNNMTSELSQIGSDYNQANQRSHNQESNFQLLVQRQPLTVNSNLNPSSFSVSERLRPQTGQTTMIPNTIRSNTSSARPMDKVPQMYLDSFPKFSQASNSPQQFPDFIRNRTLFLSSQERHRLHLLLSQISQTQSQFQAHDCLDILLGNQALSGDVNQTNWIDADEFLPPASADFAPISIESILDLMMLISGQHAQLSINVITLLTNLHKAHAEHKQEREGLTAERDSLAAERDAFAADRNALAADRESLSEQNHLLAEEVTLFKQSLDKCNMIIKAQEAMKLKMSKEMDEITREARRKEGDLTGLKRQTASMETQIERLQKDLEKSMEEIRTVRREKMELNEQYLELSRRLRENDQVEEQNKLLQMLEGLATGQPSIVNTQTPSQMMSGFEVLCQTIDERQKRSDLQSKLRQSQNQIGVHKHCQSQPDFDPQAAATNASRPVETTSYMMSEAPKRTQVNMTKLELQFFQGNGQGNVAVHHAHKSSNPISNQYMNDAYSRSESRISQPSSKHSRRQSNLLPISNSKYARNSCSPAPRRNMPSSAQQPANNNFPNNFTSIFSLTCDHLQTHLALTHQSEYILQGFKRKEQDQTLAFSKQLKDLEASLSKAQADLLKEKGQFQLKQEELQILKEQTGIKFIEQAKVIEEVKRENKEIREKWDESGKRIAEREVQVKEQLQEMEENLAKIEKQYQEKAAAIESELEEVKGRSKEEREELERHVEQLEKQLAELKYQRETVHQVNLDLMEEHERLLEKFDCLRKDNAELQKSNDVFQEAILQELNKVNKMLVDKKKQKKQQKITELVKTQLGLPVSLKTESLSPVESKSRQKNHRRIQTKNMRQNDYVQKMVSSDNGHKHGMKANVNTLLSTGGLSTIEQSHQVTRKQSRMAEEHPNYNKTEGRPINQRIIMPKSPNNIENSNWMNMTQPAQPFTEEPVTLHSSGIHSRNKTIPKFTNFNNTFSGQQTESLNHSALAEIQGTQKTNIRNGIRQHQIKDASQFDLMDVIIETLNQSRHVDDYQEMESPTEPPQNQTRSKSLDTKLLPKTSSSFYRNHFYRRHGLPLPFTNLDSSTHRSFDDTLIQGVSSQRQPVIDITDERNKHLFNQVLNWPSSTSTPEYSIRDMQGNRIPVYYSKLKLNETKEKYMKMVNQGWQEIQIKDQNERKAEKENGLEREEARRKEKGGYENRREDGRAHGQVRLNSYGEGRPDEIGSGLRNEDETEPVYHSKYMQQKEATTRDEFKMAVRSGGNNSAATFNIGPMSARGDCKFHFENSRSKPSATLGNSRQASSEQLVTSCFQNSFK